MEKGWGKDREKYGITKCSSGSRLYAAGSSTISRNPNWIPFNSTVSIDNIPLFL